MPFCTASARCCACENPIDVREGLGPLARSACLKMYTMLKLSEQTQSVVYQIFEKHFLKCYESKTMSRVHRFVSNDFTIRAAVVDATPVVAEMQNILGPSPLPTVAVGRAMVGALLMAAHLKEGQEVGIYFKASGGLGSVFAQANYEGGVRGYTPFLQYEPRDYKDGLSLSEHIGRGILTVTRHQPFQRQPHSGTVEIVSGEIGQDIAHYLHQSHQIRSVISLGVYLDTYGIVKSAGGVLIEVMPGVEEEIADKIEKNAEKVKDSISRVILEKKTEYDIVAPYLEGIPYTEIPHPYELNYYCPCTVDRVKNAMMLLGQEDFQDIIDKNEETEVVCQMCGRQYKISVDEIKELKNAQYKNSLN